MSASSKPARERAPRNRTLSVSDNEAAGLRAEVVFPENSTDEIDDINRIICGDAFQILGRLPDAKFELLFADPPYNLTKKFGVEKFTATSADQYEDWLDTWLSQCRRILKPTASIYICGDWRSSSAIQRVGSRHFKLRNRITWEREKGRGAKANWKNAAEDIWFFSVSDEYTFNLDAVKQRRRVIAPYKENGHPKDWSETKDGKFRDTHPSNIWMDITVPLW